MSKFEFKAGYYEWNLWQDDELVYTFGADSTDEITEDFNEEDLRSLVEDYVDVMLEELKENESTFTFTQAEITEIKSVIFDKWNCYYL